MVAWFALGATAIMLFAPSIIQAAFVMVIGTCPVTAVAGVCKAAKIHTCMEDGEAWERPRERDEEPEAVGANPYAGLVSGMFGRHK